MKRSLGLFARTSGVFLVLLLFSSVVFGRMYESDDPTMLVVEYLGPLLLAGAYYWSNARGAARANVAASGRPEREEA